MVLIQIRAGRIRLTLEHIDRRKQPVKRDKNKKTTQATAIAQVVKVEVMQQVTRG